MSLGSNASVESVVPSAPSPSVSGSRWRWGFSLFVAAVGAWGLLNFTPVVFDLPPELSDVDMYSPQALQTAAAERSAELYWQNSLIELGFVGFCFGAVTLLVVAAGGIVRRRWFSVIAGMVSGVLCGILAVVLCTYLRRHFNSGVELPLVAESNRQLVTDMGVYMLVSMLVVMPIGIAAWIAGEDRRGQHFISVLLAGLIGGFLTPFIASALLPHAQTNVFPPEGLALTAVWLLVIAGSVFLFTVLTDGQKANVSNRSHEGTA